MMQADCPYLVWKIVRNMDSEKIKQIQAWHKTSSKISGCIKWKKNYVNFLWIFCELPCNHDIIIAGPLVALINIAKMEGSIF